MSDHADIRVYTHHAEGSTPYSTRPIEVVEKSHYDALVAEIQQLREHVAITIETLTRGDEFEMLPDGSNPLQATIGRLRAALDGTA